jgi:hypothetical protein
VTKKLVAPVVAPEAPKEAVKPKRTVTRKPKTPAAVAPETPSPVVESKEEQA